MPTIDPTARIDASAHIGQDVTIGPFCIVGPGVVLDEQVHLTSHVVIERDTRVGARTRVGPFAVLGGDPQSLGYKGEQTTLEIGTDCLIREHATLNRGTVAGGGVTRIGNHVFMMAASHVAHDCLVGDHVVFANNATLGGHCTVGSRVFLGGLSAVHQFTRIGDFAMIGGVTGVKNDVIPYGMAYGEGGTAGALIGLNMVGMKRSGMPRDAMRTMNRLYRALFLGGGTFNERLASVRSTFAGVAPADAIFAFIDANTQRSIMMAPRGATAGGDD